jgi:hypothetical protein
MMEASFGRGTLRRVLSASEKGEVELAQPASLIRRGGFKNFLARNELVSANFARFLRASGTIVLDCLS